ncbi:MAG: bifunctional precorrin-2 dehydrogenase/sirohydrochlorin ferrochelatase [Polyangiales bacterium]
MAAFVVALQVQGRRCLVLGGGAEAFDKALKLLDAGGEVTVFAPTLDPRLAARSPHDLRWEPRDFDPRRDLDPRPFVVVATEPDAHAAVFDACRAAGVMVCCVDAPTRCDFFHTAQGACGPLTLAVASGGLAPSLAKAIRDQLIAQLDAPLRTLADALVARREATPPGDRRRVMREALHGFALEVRVTLPGWLRGG